MAPRKTPLTLVDGGGVILPPRPPVVAPCDGRAIRCPVTGLECVRECESPATCQIKPSLETALAAARAASHAVNAAGAAFERCVSGSRPSNEVPANTYHVVKTEESVRADFHFAVVEARRAVTELVRHYERRLSAERLGPPVEVRPWKPPGAR